MAIKYEGEYYHQFPFNQPSFLWLLEIRTGRPKEKTEISGTTFYRPYVLTTNSNEVTS